MFKLSITRTGSLQDEIDSAARSEIAWFADDLYNEIRRKTPVDTGKAQRGWKKSSTKTTHEISNSVDYVEVLDKGRHMTKRGIRGSKQAPRGIVGPSLQSIKGRN